MVDLSTRKARGEAVVKGLRHYLTLYPTLASHVGDTAYISVESGRYIVVAKDDIGGNMKIPHFIGSLAENDPILEMVIGETPLT